MRKASGRDAVVGSVMTSVLAVLVLLHQNGNLWLIPQESAHVASSLAPRGNRYSAPAGARLALVVMAHVTGTSRGAPRLDLSAPREPAW